MLSASLGKLKFVGRSGTAFDVRYSAHTQADMPEKHTKDVLHLYKSTSTDPSPYSGIERVFAAILFW